MFFILPWLHYQYLHLSPLCAYSTAQLQGNIHTRTHLKRASHTSQMHPGCIPNAFWICLKCILDALCFWKKMAWQLLSHVAALLQGFVFGRGVLCSFQHVLCTFWASLAHYMLHMRVNVTLELSCTVELLIF